MSLDHRLRHLERDAERREPPLAPASYPRTPEQREILAELLRVRGRSPDGPFAGVSNQALVARLAAIRAEQARG